MCLRLRPHHGLCVRFFEGKGYSDAFTVHMAEVIKKLENNPRVCLEMREDEICSCCPEFGEKGCASLEKVAAYDAAVLRLCGLTEGDCVLFSELEERIGEQIISSHRLGEVCADCEWSGICHGKNPPIQK